MCFSVQTERDFNKLLKRFGALASEDAYSTFETLKVKSQDRDWLKKELRLTRKPTSAFIKLADQDDRIFPNYFTDVIVSEQGLRTFKPMRYRIRPKNSKEEVPTKFNVFNARIDTLEFRQTWQPLFMRHHGLLPFKRFFEWVEDEEHKKRLISFNPEGFDLMWAPCLWDYWESPERELGFYSFAIITDDPPADVLQMGHDRCPIFLKEKDIDLWLNPKGSKEEIYHILKEKQLASFAHTYQAIPNL